MSVETNIYRVFYAPAPADVTFITGIPQQMLLDAGTPVRDLSIKIVNAVFDTLRILKLGEVFRC